MIKLYVARGYIKVGLSDTEGNVIEEGGFTESPTGQLIAAQIEGVTGLSEAAWSFQHERVSEMLLKLIDKGERLKETGKKKMQMIYELDGEEHLVTFPVGFTLEQIMLNYGGLNKDKDLVIRSISEIYEEEVAE